MCVCLSFHCNVRYHELVKMVLTLKLVRLEFYRGIFEEEYGDDAMGKTQECHISIKIKRRKFAIWSIWSNFDDSGYEKSYFQS